MSLDSYNPFSSLIGNTQAKTLLLRWLENRQVPNTLLFCGPSGVGKKTFAIALASALMGGKHNVKIEKGVHPDLHILQPEGKIGMHTIESVRSFIEQIALPPYEASIKVFIVSDAHRMLPTAANALLKTLEEPSFDSYIILTTDEPDLLLPTIVSRCRKVPFFSIHEKEKRIPELLDVLKSGFAYPHVSVALAKLEEELADEELDVEKKTKIIDGWLEQIAWWFRDMALVQAGYPANQLFFQNEVVSLKTGEPLPLLVLMEKLAECRKAIQHNVKPAVALEAFFLFASSLSV